MEDHEIAELAAATRERLMPLWRAFHAEQERLARSIGRRWKDPHPAHGMCRLSSAMLADVMTEATGRRWKVHGGDTWNGDVGGMLGQDGEWHAHYWIREGKTIVDITADQFGHDPVIVASSKDDRYKANYSRSELASHLANVRVTKARWVEALGNTGVETSIPKP
jgi:hypothetical protein